MHFSSTHLFHCVPKFTILSPRFYYGRYKLNIYAHIVVYIHSRLLFPYPLKWRFYYRSNSFLCSNWRSLLNSWWHWREQYTNLFEFCNQCFVVHFSLFPLFLLLLIPRLLFCSNCNRSMPRNMCFGGECRNKREKDASHFDARGSNCFLLSTFCLLFTETESREN